MGVVLICDFKEGYFLTPFGCGKIIKIQYNTPNPPTSIFVCSDGQLLLLNNYTYQIYNKTLEQTLGPGTLYFIPYKTEGNFTYYVPYVFDNTSLIVSYIKYICLENNSTSITGTNLFYEFNPQLPPMNATLDTIYYNILGFNTYMPFVTDALIIASYIGICGGAFVRSGLLSATISAWGLTVLWNILAMYHVIPMPNYLQALTVISTILLTLVYLLSLAYQIFS